MKTRLALAGIAVAAIALAGCSSSSDDSESTSSPSPTAEEMASGEPATIVEIAAGNEDFETLVAAVTAAGLAETLSGEGPFTVFAPTDDAFAALPAGVLDQLLLESNKEALTSILTYHVVDGAVMSSDITPGSVETLEGQSVAVTTDDGGVQVNGAKVVTADIEGSNGVIHVIDAVLLPPDFDPATLATS